MHARVFRRITKYFSSISKTALLVLFLFATVFGMVSIALAQSEEDIRLRYTKYLNLTNFTGSELSSAGLTQDATTQGIIGLKFNVAFSLNTSDGKTLEQAWSYITTASSSMNSSEGFLIRLCNTANPTQCWVNTIPYRGNAENGGIEENAVISRIVNSNYSPGPNITNFSAFNKNDPNNNTPGGNGQRFRYSRDTGGGKNEGTIGDFGNGIVFGPGSSVEATLWYCAENSGADSGSSAYTDSGNKGLNDTMAKFGTLCSGGTYFRIGNPLSVSIPTTTAAINAQVNNSTSTSQTMSDEDTNMPVCDISLIGKSKIVGCFARIVYYGLYWPIAWVAGLLGSLFDFFIGYSISDESYRYAFAVNGWKLVRDIANVMFIIIMVYVGFAAVFSFGGSGGSTMKRVVPLLIFNALIINFSLFATRTVIDISNVTARVFYSRMVVCEGKCSYANGSSTPENIKRGLAGYWPLSEKIVGAFDPQRMFNTSVLTPKETPTGSGSPRDPLTSNVSSDAGKKAEQGKGFAQDSSEYAGYYALVSLIAAAIMLGIASMFFNVTFMFVGRVIGLYMAMIFSPFAFLTQGRMPLFNIDRFSWKNWYTDLFKYAALAPVFIFFLYIVYSFLNTDIVKEIGVEDKTGGFFGTVLSIVIPMLFIYFLISKGVGIAKTYAGKFGEGVQNFVSGVTGNLASVAGGAAIGIASGGAALLGTRAASLLNATGATRTALMAQKAQGGFGGAVARARLGISDWSQKQTFDARKTMALKSASKTLGINPNSKLVGALGFGEDRVKGGRTGMIKRAEDETKKKIETVKSDLKNEDAGAFWENHVSKRVQKEADKKYFAELKTSGISAQEIAELKKSKAYRTEEPYKKHAEAVRKGIDETHGKVTGNKQLTQALRTEYAETILHSKKNILGGTNPEGMAARAAATAGIYSIAGLTTTGGLLAGALAAGGNTERKGIDKAASAFLKAQKDAVKKPARADRLEQENKNHQKDIENIEKIFETIPGYSAVKDNPEKAKEVVDNYRENIRNEYDELDLEVKKINTEYEAAAARGDDFTANMKKNQRFAAIANRNAKQKQYNDLDPKNVRDLRDKINRNDSELEKIKEKEDKSKDGGSEKKTESKHKDDSKEK